MARGAMHAFIGTYLRATRDARRVVADEGKLLRRLDGRKFGAIKSAQIVEFLKALRTQFKRKLLIVWDGAAQHRSGVVREYLDSTHGAIQMALLPGYAPDLNQVEYLW